MLSPFEIRFLSRAAPPDRWVIDLSKGDDRLVEPERYDEIARLEDRLFIPAEYVPLFARAGWKGADEFEAVVRRGVRAPAPHPGRARATP